MLRTLSTTPKKTSLLSRIYRNRVYYPLLLPFLIVFFTFTLLPVIKAIFYSFTQFNILEPPQWFGLGNYRKLLLNDEIFLTAVKNTLFFACITGPVSYIACLLLAWFITDFSKGLRTILTLLFYAPSLSNIFFVWLLIFSGDSYGYLNAWLTKIGLILEPIQWLTDEQYMTGVVLVIVLWGSLGTSFLSFIAGFQNVDKTLYEAGAVDGIKNRWQELWFITLPSIKPQMLFGAIMSITSSFSIGPTITSIVGFPSTNYKVHTIMHHLEDYGNLRFEMGYACAIATFLFIVMIGLNKLVQKMLSRVGQ